MKIEIDTDNFDFAYENKEFLRLSSAITKLVRGEEIVDSIDGLLEASKKEQALNMFRTKMFEHYVCKR